MRRILPFALALAAFLAPSAPAAARVGLSQSRAFAPHQIVYKLRGQRVGRAVSLPAGVSVARTAAALRSNPRVAYAEPNFIATASAEPDGSFLPDDPGTLESGSAEAASAAGNWTLKQWNFLPFEAEPGSQLPTSPGGIDAIGAWRNLIRLGDPGAAGVTVAVLDTGIAYPLRATEPAPPGSEFAPSPDFLETKFARGYDFVGRDTLPLDENGHGTHVAGTIGEQTDNRIGLTGLAYGATLMPVRVLDKEGRGNAAEIARGIRFAVEHGANVINMSFNFDCKKKVPVVDEALRDAYLHGVLTVASAGNIGSETCVAEPATGPKVISVGATTEGGCLGNYSLAGQVDLVAPGGGEPVRGCPSVLARPIYQVTLQPGSTNTFAIPSDYVGTSMAAAHVSGVAAMVLAVGHRRKGPNRLRPQHVVNAVTRKLLRSARDLGLPRTQQGAGLIDAAAATARRQFLG
jgi:serine protease